MDNKHESIIFKELFRDLNQGGLNIYVGIQKTLMVKENIFSANKKHSKLDNSSRTINLRFQSNIFIALRIIFT